MTGSFDSKAQCLSADLVYDTKTQPLSSGVRAAVQRARRVLYIADETELMLQIAPDCQPEHVRVLGQVLDEGLPVEGASVSLRSPVRTIERDTNQEGEFRVAQLPMGSYGVDVATETGVISVARLDVD